MNDGNKVARHSNSRRAMILLAAVFCLTVVLVAGAGEWGARELLPASKANIWNCLVVKNPAIGAQPIPNSDCKEESAEGSLVDYKFNSSGYRAGEEGGVRPRGVFKIVVVGSSFAMGARVDRDKSFAALLPASLHKSTGLNIDVYDMAVHGSGGRPTSVDRRFDEVLAEKPDLILWVLTPFDIRDQQSTLVATKTSPQEVNLLGSITPIREALFARLDEDRVALLIRHIAYQSQSLYLHATLPQDDEAGFLRTHPSPTWNGNYQHISKLMSRVGQRAAAAKTPVVMTLMPSRAQAAMISMNNWPAGYDPYVIGEKLRSIGEKDGIYYIDILRGFRGIPNAGQNYLAVDGHPNAAGHAIFNRLLAPELAKAIDTRTVANAESTSRWK